jgi:lipoprotein signal peptidase
MREMQAAGGTALTQAKAGDQRSAGRRVGALLAVALLVLAADVVSKAIVVATLSGRPPVRLLGGFLTLTESRNPGAAFSIGPSLTIVFSAIAIGVIAVILRTSRRIRSTAWAITLGLLLGGATGNLVDRLTRYPGPFRGYVVDWIMLPHWPVFNLADSSIVCGAVLAAALAVRGVQLDGSRSAPRTRSAAPPEPEPADSGPAPDQVSFAAGGDR